MAAAWRSTHSVKNVERRLRTPLKNAELDVIDCAGVFDKRRLSAYRYGAFYPEFSLPEFSDTQAGTLLSYVSGGGCALVLYTGIPL